MLVRHLMSTEVFALDPETTALEALRILRDRRIRRAPLLDPSGQLIGFIAQSDLLRATPATVAELETGAGRAAARRSVGSLATRKITTVHPDDHIEDVARLFLVKRIGGVPVVRRGQVVGILTESDVFRAVVAGAHLAGALRVTVQQARDTQPTPVLAVVEALGLELVGLTEYPAPDRRQVIVLRVRGERADELGDALTRAGWILLDRRLPDERRAAS